MSCTKIILKRYEQQGNLVPNGELYKDYSNIMNSKVILYKMASCTKIILTL